MHTRRILAWSLALITGLNVGAFCIVVMMATPLPPPTTMKSASSVMVGPLRLDLHHPADLRAAAEEAVSSPPIVISALVGVKRAEQIRKASIQVYEFAVQLAAQRGIIIADTKFEFGYKRDQFMLIDEVLSPDSSRFFFHRQ